MSTITSLEPISIPAHTSAIAICLKLAHRMFEHMRTNAADSAVTGQEAYQAWLLLRLTAEIVDSRRSLKLSGEEIIDFERSLGIARRASPFGAAQDIARLRSLFGVRN